MASKIKALPQKDKGGPPEKENPETPPDSPLLDLSDAAVHKMIKQAKNSWLRHLRAAQLCGALGGGYLRANRGYSCHAQ